MTAHRWIVLAMIVAFLSPAHTQTPPPTLFENVRIFDGKSGRLSAPSQVLVQGNKIARISATPLVLDEAAGAVRIDVEAHSLIF